MCQSLIELREAIASWAKNFDASLLSTTDAARVVDHAAAIRSMMATVEALAAARMTESNSWKAQGYRSAAEQLADKTGTTVGRAKNTLETGRRLNDQPEVAEAALSGELSDSQASLVANGAEADPKKTQELIEQAQKGSMSELAEKVAKTKAAAQDLEQRRSKIHATRALRFWTDLEGVWHSHATGNPEEGARFRQVVDTIRRALVVRRREGVKEGDHKERESFDALHFDSLLTLLRIAQGANAELSLKDLHEIGLFPDLADLVPASIGSQVPTLGHQETAAASDAGSAPKRRKRKVAGSKVQLMVRVDFDTLLPGVVAEGETCEIVGCGTVPVSVIEDLLRTDNVYLVTAFTKGHQVVGTAHHGRFPKRWERSALEYFYPACAVLGCNVKEGLQADHRIDWAKTKLTVYDLMDMLCRHHHRLKTEKGWCLVEGLGKRAFVPPDDPRHPGRDRVDPVAHSPD